MLGVLTRSALSLAFVAAPASAQPEYPMRLNDAPKEAPKPPGYQKLRYDEDYSYLKDLAKKSDFWDPIKYIPVGNVGDWYLTFGGEVRERYENYHNYRWNPSALDRDGYLFQRYLLHADLHLGEAVRVFGQLKTSLEHSRLRRAEGTSC